MPDNSPLLRWQYDLTTWRVPGPVEPIPLLLYQRSDLVGPKPVVVYYHGVVQSKEAYVDSYPMARRLADAGMLVAIPDAPGHGERPSGTTLIERLRASLPREFTADIAQAADEAPALLRWLSEQPGADPVRRAVLGVSMGGFTAAVVAARERDQLCAAVCIAGSADLRACYAATDSIAPGKWGPSDRAIDAPTTALIDRIDPLAYLERFAPLPLLLLHGERDAWNPYGTSERFAAALAPTYTNAPENLRFQLVPGAVHWPPNAAMVDAAAQWLSQHCGG